MMESPPIKDCYDITSWGNNMHLCYECLISGEFVSNMRFCYEAGINLYNAEYCKLSTGGSDHFGCVSMKKGKYIIFNKQYSEEDFKNLRQKIINQMKEMPYTDKKRIVYRYGEFFPPEMSPFAYNLTAANDFFPLTKDQAGEWGWSWREPEEKKKDHTKEWQDLPDHIRDVSDDILREVINCAQCGRGFKVVPMELAFLRKKNLPLPRACPFCRIEGKFKTWVQRLKLLERVCAKCGHRFKTSFSEEEAPELWCRSCYLKEVV